MNLDLTSVRAEDVRTLTKDREVLAPLVDRIFGIAQDPGLDVKKKLWADHQEMRRTAKAPVCVYYEGIPDPQWEPMIGRLQAVSAIGRSVELNIRKRLWMSDNVPDDHIVWPSVIVPAVVTRPVDWGIPIAWKGTGRAADDILEGRQIVPGFPDEMLVELVRFSDWIVDAPATQRMMEQAAWLVQDRLVVHVHYPDLGFSPFDVAAQMRGLESLMYDVMDAPASVASLMEKITSAYEQHHARREDSGWLNCHVEEGRYFQVGFRVHCAYTGPGFDPKRPRLQDEWAYISAQTSAGLGPEMYAELVHPYNVRLARMFPRSTVYYHGCECLDRKIGIIAALPNLRRFHVSPWSSVETARDALAGRAILEIHSHPGRVFFGWSFSDMKKELEGLAEKAAGAIFDLNLSDIHSVGGNPSTLRAWATAAQEVASKRT